MFLRSPRSRRSRSRASSAARWACAALLLLAFLAPPSAAQRPAARGRKKVTKPRAGKAAEVTKDAAATVPARWRAALEQVSAEDMRGHLSFISSDALEGRKTPSRGLDIPAEDIAAQFPPAGVGPAGERGSLQNA